jgi:hypothetical protein
MLDNKGFDIWADGYDEDVDVSDDNNEYPFAGYKKVKIWKSAKSPTTTNGTMTSFTLFFQKSAVRWMVCATCHITNSRIVRVFWKLFRDTQYIKWHTKTEGNYGLQK